MSDDATVEWANYIGPLQAEHQNYRLRARCSGPEREPTEIGGVFFWPDEYAAQQNAGVNPTPTVIYPSAALSFFLSSFACMPLLPRQSNAPSSGSGSSGIAMGAVAAIVVIVIGLAGVAAFFVWRRWRRKRAAGENEDSEEPLESESRATLLRRKSTFFDRGPAPEDEEDGALLDSEKPPPVPRKTHQRWHSDGSASIPLVDHHAGNHHRAGSDPDLVFGSSFPKSRLRGTSQSPSRPQRPSAELMDLPLLIRDVDQARARAGAVPIRAVDAARRPKTSDAMAVAPSFAVLEVDVRPLRTHKRGRSRTDQTGQGQDGLVDLPPFILPIASSSRTQTSTTFPVPADHDHDHEDLEGHSPGARLSRFLSYYLTRKPTSAASGDSARRPAQAPPPVPVPVPPLPAGFRPAPISPLPISPSPSPYPLDAYYTSTDPSDPAANANSNRLTRFLTYYLSPDARARKLAQARGTYTDSEQAVIRTQSDLPVLIPEIHLPASPTAETPGGAAMADWYDAYALPDTVLDPGPRIRTSGEEEVDGGVPIATAL
ncbi:hypothetical protein C8F01DRAFT_1082708 [Mycena amicta]|nr:hypothetical protein C8F01DRAFT_1082708 [Mycena amicta]